MDRNNTNNDTNSDKTAAVVAQKKDISYRSVTRSLSSTGNGIAACLASVTNTLISYPLDVVKTRFQAHDGLRTNLPKYKNTFQALFSIVKSEGVRGLYAGTSTGMLGAAVAWFSYMYLYARIKDEFEARGAQLSTRHIAVASITGGIGTMLITNPFWVIKTRLQLQLKNDADVHLGVNKHYKGPRDAFIRMAREEGLRSFYKGIVPSLVSTYHGFVQFATYEKFSSIMLYHSGMESLAGWIPILAGGTSKIFAQLCTNPFSVVRCRLQEQRAINVSDRKYSGTLDVCYKILKSEGVFGFYKGLGPSLIRLAMNSALFFYLFENIKSSLQKIDYFVKDNK